MVVLSYARTDQYYKSAAQVNDFKFQPRDGSFRSITLQELTDRRLTGRQLKAHGRAGAHTLLQSSSHADAF